MSRIYVIAPTLDSATEIANELRLLGVTEGQMHIVSADTHAEQKTHIHHANAFHTSDAWQMAKEGMLTGLLCGAVVVLVTSSGGMVAIVALAQGSVVGAAVGGLTCSAIGIGRSELNIEEHLADIEVGKHMLLVDIAYPQQYEVMEAIHDHHSEAQIETTHGALHF